MPVLSQWGNPEQTVIFLIYEKPWDWATFDAALISANAMLDTVHHSVDMIIVMHDGLPREISPARFRKVANAFHPNIRSTALVGVNDLIRWSITAFMSVLGQDNRSFFFAADVPSALRKLGHSLPGTVAVVERSHQDVEEHI